MAQRDLAVTNIHAGAIPESSHTKKTNLDPQHKATAELAADAVAGTNSRPESPAQAQTKAQMGAAKLREKWLKKE